MPSSHTRPAATLALVVLVALGLFASPATAAVAAPAADDGSSDGGAVDVVVDYTPMENSTVAARTDATSGENGGDGGIECHGTVADHSCDKGGDLGAGPATVDYDGTNRADPVNTTGGGGDYVTVGGGGESATVGFDCDLNTSVSPESCTTEANSSQGGAPLP